MSKLDKRIIDLPDKNTATYKIMDRFLDDDQKEGLLSSLLINGMWLAYHIPVLRGVITEDVMENGSFFKCITKGHVCYVAFDEKNTMIDILYRKKSKLLSPWRELRLTEDLSKMLHPHMARKKFKKTMNTIMNMKAFW